MLDDLQESAKATDRILCVAGANSRCGRGWRGDADNRAGDAVVRGALADGHRINRRFRRVSSDVGGNRLAVAQRLRLKK